MTAQELTALAQEALRTWKFGKADTHIKKGLEAIVAKSPAPSTVAKFFTRPERPDWDGLEELAIYLAKFS